MRGIDDQVENHLVEFSGQARDQRQRRIEFGFQVSHVFPLVRIRMGELFHGADNRGDACDAFEGLVDGFGNFLHQIAGVHAFYRHRDFLNRFAGQGIVFGR